jgi:xanthine dehydrogenase accessory factor
VPADAYLAEHPPAPQDAVLVVTHDPKIDDWALIAALPGPAGHVAVLGSRATHADRILRLEGTPGLDRLAGPAGLDLGAESTAETALSLLAEIVAVANGRSGARLATTSGPITGM